MLTFNPIHLLFNSPSPFFYTRTLTQQSYKAIRGLIRNNPGLNKASGRDSKSVRNEIKHVCEHVCARTACTRAIIRSNLTYPRDDSMGTGDRLKEKLCFLSPSFFWSLYFGRLKKIIIHIEQKIYLVLLCSAWMSEKARGRCVTCTLWNLLLNIL